MTPLVIALWEHTNYGGRKRVIVEDTPDLGPQGFDNTVSAVGVHPGPDYEAWKVANGGREPTIGLYEHANYGGAVLTLTTGAYPNVHRLFNFGDAISSLRFNPPPSTAATFWVIPLIVELYTDADFLGKSVVVVENVDNLAGDFGPEFDKAVTSVKVKPGPNYNGDNRVILHADPGRFGSVVILPVGEYRNLGSSDDFNDRASSVTVIPA